MEREMDMDQETPPANSILSETSHRNLEEPHFVNRVVEIRVKWLLTSLAILLGFAFLTQWQFQQQDQAERDRQELDSLSRDYLLDRAVWATKKVLYDSCREVVHRSDGNRAWKTWLLNEIAERSPDNAEAQDFVVEGRAKLNELLPPLSELVECTHPEDEPLPPPGYNPNAGPPPTLFPTNTEVP